MSASALLRISRNASPEGWIVTLVEGDPMILDALYGCPVSSTTMDDLVVPFSSYADDDAFSRHVMSIASSMVYSGSDVRGSAELLHDGNIRVTTVDPPSPPEQVSLDLKWSLWTASPENLDERSPGLSKKIARALSGEGRLLISTSPRKEIRHGTVLVQAGLAEVSFSCDWDEPSDLAGNIAPFTDEEHEIATRLVEDWLEGNGCGLDGSRICSMDRTIQGSKIEEVLAAIDAVEEDLIKGEAEMDRYFRSFSADVVGWLDLARKGEVDSDGLNPFLQGLGHAP